MGQDPVCGNDSSQHMVTCIIDVSRGLDGLNCKGWIKLNQLIWRGVRVCLDVRPNPITLFDQMKLSVSTRKYVFRQGPSLSFSFWLVINCRYVSVVYCVFALAALLTIKPTLPHYLSATSEGNDGYLRNIRS